MTKEIESEDKGTGDDLLITETGTSFRDRVSTIGKKGGRVWVYPTKPKGAFHRARVIVSIFLLGLFYGLPFFKPGGEPFLLLNMIERKFIIFGMHFYPQDFYIFALGFLALFIFIVLFTAVYGRLWCGWACPQTVFMEMIFRKIEYFIEGDAPKQRKLNTSPMSFNKFIRKSLKHFIFFAISVSIVIFFTAYIVGIDEVGRLLGSFPGENAGVMIAFIILAGAVYFIFSWFREQACTMVCPYARLQSVLLDKNSIVVSYDNVRGEPRGKMKEGTVAQGNGDCIDCGNCVRVCPTGIDIRNGVQLECVNCTACIDACDSIMAKISKPKKLIRYASFNQINLGTKFRFTPRVIIYTVLLAALIGIVTFIITTRSDVTATIVRARGTLFQEAPDGTISNLYLVKLVNKMPEKINVELKLEDIQGKIELAGKTNTMLEPDAISEIEFFVRINKNKLDGMKSNIYIGIYSNDKRLDKIKTTFIGPNK